MVLRSRRSRARPCRELPAHDEYIPPSFICKTGFYFKYLQLVLCEDIRIGLHKQPECFATWSLFLVKRVLVEETLLVGARVFLLNVPVKCDDEQAH